MAGSLLCGGVLAVSVLSGSLQAGATTAVKLYVSTTGTGTACTKASPCSSISQAASVALSHGGDIVSIKVAAGTYDENDSIDASSLASLSLVGAGASSTIVNGGGTNTVMTFAAGTVSLSGLTIENGNTQTNGGGIDNSATLTVSDSNISSSQSLCCGGGGGGGIFNQGSLTVNDSTLGGSTNGEGGGIENAGQLNANDVVFGGSADNGGGGAIFNTSTGTATIDDSSVSGTAPFNAGAIRNDGNLHLNDSTVSGSSAKGGGAILNGGSLTISSSTLENNGGVDGGAISNSGNLIIDHSTLMGNHAEYGGAIDNGGTLSLYDSTLVDNTTTNGPCSCGAALDNSNIVTMIGTTVADNMAPQIDNSGTLTTAASIVADATAAPTSVSDCENSGSGTVSDLGYNLSDDSTCGLSASTDVNANPELGALGANGGPTQTQLPALGSPATGVIPIGAVAGSTQLCGRVDQRGVASIGNCTIGAVEGGFLIETASLPDASPGSAYPPTQLAVQNEGTSSSPYQTTLKWKGLTLPSWLTLSSTGVLSGTTPKSGALGTYSITIKVTETVTTVSAGVKTKTKTKTTVEATLVLTVAPRSSV
jgi:Putative Ig domain